MMYHINRLKDTQINAQRNQNRNTQKEKKRKEAKEKGQKVARDYEQEARKIKHAQRPLNHQKKANLECNKEASKYREMIQKNKWEPKF